MKLGRPKLHHPDEWDISVPELAMLLEPITHGQKRLTFVMSKFYIDQRTASYWVKLVRDYEQEREAS